MPIYEFLCPDCNRIYSFLQRGAAARTGPECPRCGAGNLQKQVSRFAFTRSAASRGADPSAAGAMGGPGGPDPLDDPRIEREMMRLARDAEFIDENDPRQLARLMRKMSQVTGEPFDEGMEEAVRRLESGEDPDRIEDDMGDAIDASMGGSGASGRSAPTRDEGLYSY
jgi:putative FmdB family regulatory protein